MHNIQARYEAFKDTLARGWFFDGRETVRRSFFGTGAQKKDGRDFWEREGWVACCGETTPQLQTTLSRFCLTRRFFLRFRIRVQGRLTSVHGYAFFLSFTITKARSELRAILLLGIFTGVFFYSWTEIGHDSFLCAVLFYALKPFFLSYVFLAIMYIRLAEAGDCTIFFLSICFYDEQGRLDGGRQNGKGASAFSKCVR